MARGSACEPRGRNGRTRLSGQGDRAAGEGVAAVGEASKSYLWRGRSKYNLPLGFSKRSAAGFHNIDSAILADSGDAESSFPSGSYGAVQAGLCEGQGARSSHARAIALWRSGDVHVMGDWSG